VLSNAKIIISNENDKLIASQQTITQQLVEKFKGYFPTDLYSDSLQPSKVQLHKNDNNIVGMVSSWIAYDKYIQIFKENVPDTWFKVDTSGDRKLMSNNAETDHGVFVKWIKPEKNKYFLFCIYFDIEQDEAAVGYINKIITNLLQKISDSERNAQPMSDKNKPLVSTGNDEQSPSDNDSDAESTKAQGSPHSGGRRNRSCNHKGRSSHRTVKRHRYRDVYNKKKQNKKKQIGYSINHT